MSVDTEAVQFEDLDVERLVDFLYILARDELPVGSIESIMWDQVTSERSEYCNPFLEGWARNMVERLLGDGPITNWNNMYKPADAVEGVIGAKDIEQTFGERPPYPELVSVELVFEDDE